MSRKGNSPDNGMMESFFGILKSEMFYGYEKTFKSIEHLEQAIADYINYYNNKRIKVKLKGLSPWSILFHQVYHNHAKSIGIKPLLFGAKGLLSQTLYPTTITIMPSNTTRRSVSKICFFM